MTNRALPIRLTIVALFATIGIAVVEEIVLQQANSYVFALQLFMQYSFSLVFWMIGCFIALRQGSTDWTSRWVPIGLAIFLIFSHDCVKYWMSFLVGTQSGISVTEEIASTMAIGLLSFTVANSVCLAIASRVTQVTLRQVNCNEPIAPSRLTIQMILVVTSVVAIVLSLQSWATSVTENAAGVVSNAAERAASQAMDLLFLVAYCLCNAAAFFGVVWMIVSARRRWLGLCGLIFWLVSPTAQFAMMMWMTPLGIPILSLLPMVIASCVLGLAGTLMTFPVFRLFGYQFRIGDQVS